MKRYDRSYMWWAGTGEMSEDVHLIPSGDEALAVWAVVEAVLQAAHTEGGEAAAQHTARHAQPHTRQPRQQTTHSTH